MGPRFLLALAAALACACTSIEGTPGTDEALAGDPAPMGQNIFLHPDDPDSFVSNPAGRQSAEALVRHCAGQARMVVNLSLNGALDAGFYAEQSRVLVAAGIEPYLIINGESVGLGNTGLDTDWARTRVDMARTAGEVARALAARGTRAAIEVWNEPDDPPTPVVEDDPSLSHVPADQFGAMVGEVASAVKAACPACRVVTGGLEGAPAQSNTGALMAEYMRTAFPAGLPAGVDAIGVHYVLTPDDVAWAGGAPIAVTESFEQVTPATLGLAEATIILGQDYTPTFDGPGACGPSGEPQPQPQPSMSCALTLEVWTGAESTYTDASASIPAGSWVRWWVESNPGGGGAWWNTGGQIPYYDGGNYNCEPGLYNPDAFPACGHSDWFEIPAGSYDRSATFAGPAGETCMTLTIQLDAY